MTTNATADLTMPPVLTPGVPTGVPPHIPSGTRVPWWRKVLIVAAWNVVLMPVSLLLLELALRVAYPAPIEAVPAFYRPDPDAVFSLDTHVDMSWSAPDFTFHLVSNEMGLREDRAVPAKEANEFRIVCIGDSTTFGMGVQTNETYPRRLEALLTADMSRFPTVSKVTVWNAGCVAFNTAQVVAVTDRLVESLDADLVIFGLSASFSFRASTELPRDLIVKNGVAVPKALGEGAQEPWLSVWRKRSRLVAFVDTGLEGVLDPQHSSSGDGVYDLLFPEWIRQHGHFKLLREKIMELREDGRDGMIVYFPDMYHANQDKYETLESIIGVERYEKANQRWIPKVLAGFAEPDKIVIIDPTIRILRDERGAHSFFPLDRHLNARGLDAVAREVEYELVRLNAIHE